MRAAPTYAPIINFVAVSVVNNGENAADRVWGYHKITRTDIAPNFGVHNEGIHKERTRQPTSSQELRSTEPMFMLLILPW
jgi:hypothetical protein